MKASCALSVPVLACTFLVLAAADVSAHGWVFTGPAGGGGPGYTGPAGGGEVGPTGAGGASSGSEPEPGNATPGARTGGTPTAPGTNPAAGSGGRVGIGGTTRGGRPKSARAPWLDRVAVPWVGVFPGLSGEAGYQQSPVDAAEALRRPVSEGGWARESGPSLLAEYDSSNPKHVELLKTLDRDDRFTAAAQLFNCFKLDTFGGPKPVKEIRLVCHLDDGSLAGEARGDSGIRKAFDLVEGAWKRHAGKEIGKVVPRIAELLGAIAYFDHHRELAEEAIVCPDCGHERHDAMETAAEMKLRRGAAAKALADLRKS